MNRKNTIFLAVFINAGLVVILFVTALSSQDEIVLAPTHEISAAPFSSPQHSMPVFSEEMDLALKATADPLPQILPHREEIVMHTLPPVAPLAVSTVVEVPSSFVSISQEVVVKKGDTLEKLAKAYQITVDDIIKMNHLPSSFLRVGQKLKLPLDRSMSNKVSKTPISETKSADIGPDYYTVKVGDNPWTIAMKHHLKVDELLRLNALNDEKARKLKPGDRLRIR